MPAPVTPSLHPLYRAQASRPPAIPDYLLRQYGWAYVHPRAVRFFEREWLVNLILWGHYARLCERALDALGPVILGKTLQMACVYGNLTARLDVLDILPIQLQNLAAKIEADPRVRLVQGNTADAPQADASVDQVLMFFLLHEQPRDVRQASLREAQRVLRPGGRLVLVDYHRPNRWHPLQLLMRGIFWQLEPFAMDLWTHSLDEFLPSSGHRTLTEGTEFGGLYQWRVVQKG